MILCDAVAPLLDIDWAALPLDGGTKQVLADGVRILYDPRGLLENARRAALP